MDAFFVGILGFFVFGAAGFYLISFIALGWFFILINFADDPDKDGWGWGVTAFLGYLFFLQLLGRINLFGFFTNGWKSAFFAVLWVIGFFFIGFVWSLFKTWLHANEKAEKLKIIKAKFYADHTNESDVDERWKRSCDNNKLKFNVDKIVLWIIYWPISAIWTLLNNLIKRLFRLMVIRCKKWYQGIIDGAYKDL